MWHHNSLLHQLLQTVPWDRFEGLVDHYGADARVRRLTTKSQLIALLYAQLSGAQSLREIEQSLASHQIQGARPCPNSSMKCHRARNCTVEMRAFQIIEEGIQFAYVHVADVVPPTEAFDDDAIAHGWRGLGLKKGCLGLGYGNGLVISHRTALARRDCSVDALVEAP